MLFYFTAKSKTGLSLFKNRGPLPRASLRAAIVNPDPQVGSPLLKKRKACF
jgi:hypothetical protein